MRTALAVALLFLLSHPATADIVMTPYLQATVTNCIQVVTECTSTSTATVDYGLTAAYGNTAVTEIYEPTTNGTYVHSVRLKNLAPNTLYHYRVRQGSSTSADATFKSPPLPGTSFRFAWIGDDRGGGSIYDGILQKVQAANPVLILHGGDISSDGSYSSVKGEFFTPTALSVYSHIPYVVTIGNHEQWSEKSIAFDETPVSASGSYRDYYSVDFGDLHVLVLLLYTGDNTYYDTSPGSPQYLFAQSDLSSTRQQWKVVMSHKVPYTYSSDGHVEATELFPIDQNVMAPNKVDVWFGAHNHFYQHSTKNGINYETIGSTGAELYTPAPGSNATYLNMKSTYCYGIVDVTPTAFTLTVYDQNGVVLDNLNLTKIPAHAGNGHESPFPESRLDQNYPNPFNPSTTIIYSLKKESQVTLAIYDVLGREVKILVDGKQTGGEHSIAFSGRDLPSGVYFYRLRTEEGEITKQMVLLR